MRKRRQVEAINGEVQLPQPIIHRIQSFLTANEAAQTAILSKSWHSAWSTRPNLDLDLDNFGGDDLSESEFDEFSELAKKTIQRYEQSNLNIESFRLCMTPREADLDSKLGSLGNDLITRALKIGATHLNVLLDHTDVLPQVVFEAENLVGLSVYWCKIDNLGFGQKVRCSKLESLSLHCVEINSEMVSNIASNCPMIGKLSLCNVSSFNDDGHVNYYSFLGDLSSKFPFLKDLTLQGCKTQEVSSRSIERLYFSTGRSGLSVKFDVPSIRKLTFGFYGHDIPSLSFATAPREWEFDVIISVRDGSLSTLWFRRLNKFLTESSLSRISLSLTSFSYKKCMYEVGDIRGLPKPKLENLTIDEICPQALRCFALFHGLFQICRPKFITLDHERSFSGKTRRNDDLLWKTLARGLDNKCMYGLHDLEEVNVHLFDEDDVWRPLPLKSLFDPSIILTSLKSTQTIRFQLKWKT